MHRGRLFRGEYRGGIRFYLQNIGEGYKLVAVQTPPDGSIEVYEIAEPMKWTLSYTLNL